VTSFCPLKGAGLPAAILALQDFFVYRRIISQLIDVWDGLEKLFLAVAALSFERMRRKISRAAS